MDSGRKREFGFAEELLADPRSHFSRMVDSGPKELRAQLLEKIQQAKVAEVLDSNGRFSPSMEGKRFPFHAVRVIESAEREACARGQKGAWSNLGPLKFLD